MASAGTFISMMTTNPAIYCVGLCIGRGTIISMILVMGVLPEILLLGDTIIEKTAFNIKYPAIVQTTEAAGMVRLDGRVRGTISGKIDAEVHGILIGDVSAVITAGQLDVVKEVKKLEHVVDEDHKDQEEDSKDRPDQTDKTDKTEKGDKDDEN